MKGSEFCEKHRMTYDFLGLVLGMSSSQLSRYFSKRSNLLSKSAFNKIDYAVKKIENENYCTVIPYHPGPPNRLGYFKKIEVIPKEIDRLRTFLYGEAL